MDKVVVITGANSGIGYAAAKVYESKGYFVVLGCRNQEKGIAGPFAQLKLQRGDKVFAILSNEAIRKHLGLWA